MHEAVMTVDDLSLRLRDRFSGRKLKVLESSDSVVILPIAEGSGSTHNLVGMLAGSGVSTESFMLEKQAEKALER